MMRALSRSALSVLAFPASFGAAIVAAAWALGRGLPEPLVAISITVAAVIVTSVLERIHPYEPAWSKSRGDVPTDLAHGVVSMLVCPALFEVALLGSVYAAAHYLSSRTGASLWPSSWPMLLQLPFTVVVAELPSYWAHRLTHESPWLFRFHATHHSSERLYWLNAGRFHPIDATVSYALQTSTVVLLGAGPEQLALLTVWASVHGLFQHANVDVRLGPLNYVFSMAELHRWHHSRTLQEANANYGNHCIFWDLVFGTFYWPADRRPPKEIGIADFPDFPRDYVGQLLSVVRWKHLRSLSASRAANPDLRADQNFGS